MSALYKFYYRAQGATPKKVQISTQATSDKKNNAIDRINTLLQDFQDSLSVEHKKALTDLRDKIAKSRVDTDVDKFSQKADKKIQQLKRVAASNKEKKIARGDRASKVKTNKTQQATKKNTTTGLSIVILGVGASAVLCVTGYYIVSSYHQQRRPTAISKDNSQSKHNKTKRLR